MTTNELSVFLEEHNVPEKLYRIGKRSHNRICLEKDADGWEVYFYEKKHKIGTMRFADEGSACAAMKNELRKLMEALYGLTWSPLSA